MDEVINNRESDVENIRYQARFLRMRSLIMKLTSPLMIAAGVLAGYGGYHDHDSHEAELTGIAAGIDLTAAMVVYNRANILRDQAFDMRLKAYQSARADENGSEES